MSAVLLLCACWSFSLWTPTRGRTGGHAGGHEVEPGPVSLNEMFREVEELMEDTQHLLEEAVDQINTESRKTSNQLQNQTTRNPDRTLQDVDDPSAGGLWNSLNHDCLVDEDCGDQKFCLYEVESSQCLPCIPTDMPCTKDQECCGEQLCVWGQCTEDAVPGSEGTVCQGQSDCRRDLCCAFQREFLFPVCNPRPGKGDSCLNQPNLLIDMLAWDQEGPRDHCPCAQDLQCQPHGRGSVCGAARTKNLD
ncbi:unnamed protein product [Ophioblennius macclurei]